MLNVLHCHSTFSLGGKEARAVALMNAFGDAARHTILTSVPGALGARDAIAPGIEVAFPDDAPPLYGWPGLARYRQLARYMRRFDLVLTYNWGAMDAVLARRLLPWGCPPIVHHEDGFNADEAAGLKPKRNVLRRVGLPTTHAVVVPSTTLETIARTLWHQPSERVHRISNGIATARYAVPPQPDVIPGLIRQPGEIVVGTLAGLRGVKNLPRLVRAALAIPNVRLVIVGQGPERDAIVSAANTMAAQDRLVMPGFLPDPHRYLGLFDVFALSSDSEQFPISLIEAMAAGLPVASVDVGDVGAILPPTQQRFVVECSDAPLSAALRALADDAGLRATLGDQNRRYAVEHHDETAMIDRYARLYDEAIGNGMAYLMRTRL